MSNDKFLPMLKTVEQMQTVSGLGVKKLMTMIHNGEIDYIKNGNRYLLTEQAILEWYNRSKVRARRNVR